MWVVTPQADSSPAASWGLGKLGDAGKVAAALLSLILIGDKRDDWGRVRHLKCFHKYSEAEGMARVP